MKLIIFTSVIGDEAGPCITVGGNKAGQPCVFPFTNNGVTYSGCTTDDDPDSKLWCSVATDDAGNHLKGSWGHCPREGCPLDQQECILHSGDQGACTPLALCGAGFFPTQEDVEACSTQGESMHPQYPHFNSLFGQNTHFAIFKNSVQLFLPKLD